MAKRTFTLTDWWEQTQPRLIRGFRRGAVLLCLGIGFLIIAVAFVAASADKPEPPWWSLVKWIAWFNKDRNGHLVALITAAISAGSFVLAAWPIWFSQEAAHHRKRHKEVLEKLDALGAQGDVHEQLLRQALSKLDALAGQRVEGEERKKRDEATANLPEAELLLLRAGDFDQASQAMEARIASEDHSAALARAAQWRDAGAIANGIDTAKALQYYENAARLDPGDCWTHIFLSRLHAAAGSTAKAEAAAKAGIAAATNDRDRSGALDMVGNIAVAKGDLTAARKAYEDSLAIAKALSARDPRNTQWKRDLSVSYSQLGDLAVAEGDLPAARKAYEDSLAIAKDLSARDPGNTGWKRDLSVSYDRLGDVARDEGDLTAARKAYEDSLAIRKYLSARDPANTEWKRDLSVSSDRLGDVAVAEGDLPAARKAYEDSLAIRKGPLRPRSGKHRMEARPRHQLRKAWRRGESRRGLNRRPQGMGK